MRQSPFLLAVIGRPRRAAPLLLTTLLALASTAGATGQAPEVVNQGLGVSLSRGVIILPMREGVYQTQISGSYLNIDSNSQGWATRMKGVAETAAATYGLSKHWGLSLLAGADNIYGTNSLSVIDPSGRNLTPPYLPPGNYFNMPSTDHGHGVTASLSLIWDHWTGDGFRMPVYLGGGYTDMTQTSDDAVDGIKRTGKISSPSVLVGLAPSFGLWKFRAMGFFMISAAMIEGDGSIIGYDKKTGVVKSRSDFKLAGGLDAAVPIAGLDLTYVPWGLGFTLTPDVTGEGVSAYSLKWSHEWGGPSRK